MSTSYSSGKQARSRSSSCATPVSKNNDDKMRWDPDSSADCAAEFLLNSGDFKQQRRAVLVLTKGSRGRERLFAMALVVVLAYLLYHWWWADGIGSRGGSKNTSIRQSQPEKAFSCSRYDPFFLCPFQITEGAHESSPPPPPPPGGRQASCWNATESENSDDHKFCNRYIRANHKMGHILTKTLFGRDGTYHFPGEEFQPEYKAHFDARGVPDLEPYFNRNDYREIFITRNWIDSLVSGYLYHKTGRECHLDLYGKPMRYRDDQPTHPNNFEKLLMLPGDYPAVEHRYLCDYLAEESVEHGLRVYAEWAIRYFYWFTLLVFRDVQEREDPLHRRTMFLCYDKLNNPETREETVHKIKDWFYPGGLPRAVPPAPQETYSGGHSTSHDPELRMKLRRILEELDVSDFHGAIRRHSETFGCEAAD